MNTVAARIFFVSVPALAMGALFSLLHPAFGMSVCLGMIGLGIDATKAKPERGERA